MPPVARIARYGVLAVAAVLAWLMLPAGVGGGTTYLATHGVSMEPLFHAGDLAVVHAGGNYAVGDVVAYHSALLDTTVLHRIIGSDDGAFTTQGDNNSWQDPDHPTEDQIIGRLWVAVPHGGQALAFLRSPYGLAALGLVVTAVTALLDRKRRRPSGERSTPLASTRSAAGRLVPAATVAAAVAVVGGVAAFLVPATETVDGSAALSVHGAYTYTGPAQRGVTYPDGMVTTGDAVWRSLASAITVRLDQTVDGPGAPATLGGSLRLDLSVATPDGWSAPLVTGGTSTPSGDTLTASVPLDLEAAAALAQRHYAEIGSGGDSAVVTVTPVGEVTGQADGQSFSAPAPAALAFTLGEAALTVDDPAALSSATSVGLAATATAPRTVALLGVAAPISVLRGIACLLLAVALVVLAAGGALVRSGEPAVPPRYRARTVRVAAVPAATEVVEVPDLATLHRVAEQRSALVLHHEDANGPTFLVQDGPATYRFRRVPAAPRRADQGRPSSHRRPAPSLLTLFARLAQS